MVFGEIIEPSTRALILDDDELEDLPEYEAPTFQWEGLSKPPNSLDTIIFIESPKVLKVCSKTLNTQKPVAKLLNTPVSIYKFDSQYLVTFNGNCNNLTTGEIVEALSEWIEQAKSVHCITSTSISAFQSWENLPKGNQVTFSRCLTTQTEVPFSFCRRLEAPNLIQGFVANVFSYCVCLQGSASLWIVYTDNMSLDSSNASEIVRLFKVLELPVEVDFKPASDVSNLYIKDRKSIECQKFVPKILAFHIMQAKNISLPKQYARIDYEIPERYRNAFYLANAALFDSTNWFLHRTYEVVFHNLKNMFRHKFKDQKVSDAKIHDKLENIVESLDQCNSIIDVRFPIRRENGKLEIVRGFRVHYGEGVQNAPCLGGLRIHPDITRDQMKGLAVLSFMKNSCLGTGLSGAMGGIKINPKEYSEMELQKIVSLYVTELFKKGFCNHTSVVHPDINSGEREMNWVSQTFASCSGQTLNATTTGKPLEYGGVDNYDKVTAMGAFKALDFIVGNGELLLKTGCIKTGINNKRFIIQVDMGLGKVGKNLGLMLVANGGICVGVKDHDAYLYDPKGIDFKDLLGHLEKHGTIRHYGLAKTDYPETIFTEDCDILVLAACQKSLGCYTARDVKARVVLEAADAPITPTAHKILITKSKIVIPDIYSCGGANVASYFEYVRNLQQVGFSTENVLRGSTKLYSEIFENMLEQSGQKVVGGSQEPYNVFLPLENDFSKNCIECIFTSVGQDILNNIDIFRLGVDLRTAAYAVAIDNIFKVIFEQKNLT